MLAASVVAGHYDPADHHQRIGIGHPRGAGKLLRRLARRSGASHERSVFFTVLPAAKSGVFAAVILGMGRAVGETMAVIMVAGNQTAILPGGLAAADVRTLTANIVLEMAYAADLHRERADCDGGRAVRLYPNHQPFLLAAEKEGEAVNAKRRRLQSRRPCGSAVYAAGACTLGVLLMLVVYILVKGLPHLTPELFSLALQFRKRLACFRRWSTRSR